MQNAFDFATPITANTDLYARWEEIPEDSFLVSFVTGAGASNVEGAFVKEGQKVAVPQTPTREGYRFLGWFTEEALQNAFDFDTPITSNTDLYAGWKEILSYAVTFDLNAADAKGQPEGQTVQEGTKATPPTNPTRGGYTFEGWFTDEALQNAFSFETPIEGETILYAKWEEIPDRFLIPDEGFRGKLKSLLPDAFSGDYLLTQHDTLSRLSALDVSGLGITDLTGIKFFTALRTLNASTNSLGTVDLSLNAALTEVDFSDNQLTALNLSQNAALTTLDASTNDLEALNLSQNASLKSLDVSSNDLDTLDLSLNVFLTEVDVSSNLLTSLDLRGMRSATELTIGVLAEFNPLARLRVHESLKDDDELKAVKTQRGDRVTIETYSAEAGSVDYRLVCGDYDPNAGVCVSTDSRPYFTVTFRTNEGGDIPPQTVPEGDVANPQTAARPNYLFGGWFTDPNFENAFAFDTPITQDIILYAKWESIPEKFLIPDANFRNKLKSRIPAAFDADDNLLTQHGGVTGLTVLDVRSSSIADLTGIEYFTALRELYCDDNQLKGLDVSQNTALTGLSCNNNQLTDLDVSQNTALRELYCDDNQLKGLDVSQNTALTGLSCNNNQLTDLDVSQNTALTGLNCYDNQLKDLNVSQNTALTQLWCYNNQLTGLDVSQNNALTGLNCYNSKLTKLNISQNTALTYLACSDNQLRELDVSNNTALKELYCHNNELKDLNLLQQTALTSLSCDGNQLTELDIRGMRSASFLRINASSFNPLDTLRVHENLKDHDQIKNVKTNRGDEVIIATYAALEGSTTYNEVCLDYDPRTSVCNSAVTAAEFVVAFQLNGGGTDIPDQTVEAGKTAQQPPDPTRDGYTFEGWFTDPAYQNAFDFSSPITSSLALYAKWELETVAGRFLIPDANFRNALKSVIPDAFDAQDRLITGHDQVTTRTALYVRSSSIADLTGIEYFTALKELYCSNNQLTSLNVFQNTALTNLDCDDNDLTSLDVSRNTALTRLNCTANELTSLDVSRNTALTRLVCYDNQLTSLDVSRNTALGALFCYSNQLKELNVSQNVALTLFRCHDNQLTELDMSGMRRVDFDALQIDATASGSNPLKKLLVHENLQDHAQIKDAKTNRGAEVIIETYSADPASADYTLVCGDYDPNAGSCLSAKKRLFVDFQTNGGSSVATQEVKEGETVSEPSSPTRDGYVFLGWYSDASLRNAFSFSTPVNDDMILYARWAPESVAGLFYIPDDNFRNKLKTLLSPDAFDNLDRLRTQHDAVTGHTRLDVSYSGIADLTGVEYFTALQRLYCQNNLLTSLDVSQNTALKVLNCQNNQLTELDMRGIRDGDPIIRIFFSASSPTENPLETLRMHENMINIRDGEIRRAQEIRGDKVAIETYSADPGSTDYTLVCLDYDLRDGARNCNKAAP